MDVREVNVFTGEVIERNYRQEEIDAIIASLNSVNTVPQSVMMRQARRALLQAGLLSAVNGAVQNMPGAEGDAARIDWEFSSAVHRNWPVVQSLAPVLGMTDEQLDQLFITAAQL